MMEQVLAKEIAAGTRVFSLTLGREDLTAIYPGFFRYTLTAESGGSTVALFRTNTCEYAPGVPLEAEAVARDRAARWEQEIRAGPDGFIAGNKPRPGGKPAASLADVVIIQGSPRADGNSATLAQWAEEAARERGMSCTVLYPHDMDIRECIGCYQCFNTGACIFDDDMAGVIGLASGCRLLVICTPVYTNTVPANLKALADRFQAYSAAQTLGFQGAKDRRGVMLSVSGRTGQVNFTCIRKVLTAFLHTAGIAPSGEVFIDGVDRFHDIRKVAGLRERVAGLIAESLKS